jgi:hypothetical protein
MRNPSIFETRILQVGEEGWGEREGLEERKRGKRKRRGGGEGGETRGEEEKRRG